MSTFSFLTPLYLIGLAAAGIPLLIHLSRSRRTRKMRFSTTRFFTDQFLRSYRMSRLKELLLLACRMALFALLAMALARPFVLPKGSAMAGLGGGPRTVVLVLDDSASMGYVEDGAPLFRRAQEAARAVLATLAAGDTASVVLAGRRASGPEVLFAEPTDDLDAVRTAIDRTPVSALATDLSGAITRAEEAAVSSRAAGRAVSIYILSDLQESGWEVPSRETIRADAADLAFVFVSVRPRSAPVNRGVTAVRTGGTRPRVGVPVPLRPLFTLAGDNGGDATVSLHIDGAKVGEQRVERLPGGKWAATRFYHAFPTAGWHGGWIEVDDPVFPADNRRFFALEVPAQTRAVPVLAVNGAPSSVPELDELAFLRAALTAGEDAAKRGFDIRAVSPGEVAAADLSTYPLVILANVERLTESAVEKLEGYVDGGGSLLVFLGDKVDRAFYNGTLAGGNRRHGGLLPATIKEAAARPVGHVGAMVYEHRALARFAEPPLGRLLGPALTFKALEVDASPAAVLMRSSDGPPLLLEKAFGNGRVLLFTSTADRDWGDFAVRPAFPLWAHFMAEYLTQPPLALQDRHRTGDVVRLRPPADEKGVLWVRKPDGTKVVAARASDGSGDFEFADAQAPGVYTVLRSDQETPAGLFAVNLDAYESDLTYLDDELPDDPKEREMAAATELKARLGQPPLVSYIADPSTLESEGGGGRRGMKLWDVLLIVVLLIGLFEPWLANQISGRLYARQTAPPQVAAPPATRVMSERLAAVPADGGAR